MVVTMASVSKANVSVSPTIILAILVRRVKSRAAFKHMMLDQATASASLGIRVVAAWTSVEPHGCRRQHDRFDDDATTCSHYVAVHTQPTNRCGGGECSNFFDPL